MVFVKRLENLVILKRIMVVAGRKDYTFLHRMKLLRQYILQDIQILTIWDLILQASVLFGFINYKTIIDYDSFIGKSESHCCSIILKPFKVTSKNTFTEFDGLQVYGLPENEVFKVSVPQDKSLYDIFANQLIVKNFKDAAYGLDADFIWGFDTEYLLGKKFPLASMKPCIIRTINGIWTKTVYHIPYMIQIFGA